MKNKERTKRKTLERCLEYLTRLMKMDSKNGAGFEPADGETEGRINKESRRCGNTGGNYERMVHYEQPGAL